MTNLKIQNKLIVDTEVTLSNGIVVNVSLKGMYSSLYISFSVIHKKVFFAHLYIQLNIKY